MTQHKMGYAVKHPRRRFNDEKEEGKSEGCGKILLKIRPKLQKNFVSTFVCHLTINRERTSFRNNHTKNLPNRLHKAFKHD